MAKLSEVLGSILKDVTCACATSDLVSVNLYESYQTTHPLLAKLPVPRVTVKEVSLKLKFVIQELSQVTYEGADLSGIVQMWNTHLTGITVPQVYAAALGKRELDLATTKLLSEAVRGSDLPEFSLAEALQGNTKPFLDQSIAYVVAIKSNLPKDLGKQVPTLPDLRKLAQPMVEGDMIQLLPSMRRIAVAKMALDMDLDITPRKADLEKAREPDVQQIDLTLVMDSIQTLHVPEASSTDPSSNE